MEYRFLPEAVKNTLNLPDGTEPDLVMRGSGGTEGGAGESYVVLCGHDVFIFERKFGDSLFKRIDIDLREPFLPVELHNDTFNSVLTLGGCKIRLSSFEAGSAALLVGTAAEFKHRSQAEERLEPNPYLLLLMMLIDLAVRADNEGRLPPTAEHFIVHSVCSGNRKIVEYAKILYNRDCLDSIFQSLTLSDAQKRCMLANMLELSMHDGEFSSNEQDLIHEAAAKLNIRRDDFDRIWNVILDKNCLSILTDG